MLAGMTNMNQPPTGGPQDNWLPPDGRPQDNWPTQQFGPADAQPADAQPRRPARDRRSLRWSAGLALAALLAGGGALAGTDLTGSPAPGPGGSPGQAAALNTILSSASSPVSGAASGSAPGSSAATTSSAGTAAQTGAGTQTGTGSSAGAAALSGTKPAGHGRAAVAWRCRRAVARLRAGRHPRAAHLVARFCRRRMLRVRALGGLHGQFTFKTKSGPRTIAFSRGVVESVTARQLVVKSADGTTWTWDLVSNTVVRQDGKKVAASALAKGERVFAGGPVISGANDARLIVIRPAGRSSSG